MTRAIRLRTEVRKVFKRYEGHGLEGREPADLVIPYERPTADLANGVLNYGDNERATETERIFYESLIHQLEFNKLGAPTRQEYIAIDVEPTLKKDDKLSKQLTGLYEFISKPKFVICRPDFCFPRYGLVIEIDGSVHDNSLRRVHRDNVRDALYKIIGCDCLRVSNEQVLDPVERSKIIGEIITHLKSVESNPANKQKYQNRRTTMSRHRMFFKKSGAKFDIGGFTRRGGNKRSQWGGLPRRLIRTR